MTAPLSFSHQPSSNPTSAEDRQRILENPGFGKYFTDHMVRIEYSRAEGWHNAEVVPHGPISLDPSAMVLHYGQAIFEGLKAYRHDDGEIYLFRPEENAARFASSAHRLAIPELPEEVFLQALKELIAVDHEWVPAAGGEEALYFRPFAFATEPSLGVRPADNYVFLIIASPAGAYFSGGISPVSVWLSKEFVRASPGGTGAAKFAGNYAASLLAQQQAADEGCDQVVWLDAVEREYVEEMGGMNLFFVFGSGEDAEFVTPTLSGSLLPGITRDSLIRLAQAEGYKVTERKISVDEWRTAATDGSLTEVFACGTAAVITPVGKVRSAAGDFTVNGGQPGALTMKLREQLTGIQRGTVPDQCGWLHKV